MSTSRPAGSPSTRSRFAPLLACLAAPLVAQAVVRPAASGRLDRRGRWRPLSAVVTCGLVRDDWALQRTWQSIPTAAAWLLARRGPGHAGRPGLACARRERPGRAGRSGAGLVAGRRPRPADARTTRPTTGTARPAPPRPPRGSMRTWRPTRRTWPPRKSPSAATTSATSTRTIWSTSSSIGRRFDGTWAGEPLHALVTWQREPYVADLFSRAFAAVELPRDGPFRRLRGLRAAAGLVAAQIRHQKLQPAVEHGAPVVGVLIPARGVAARRRRRAPCARSMPAGPSTEISSRSTRREPMPPPPGTSTRCRASPLAAPASAARACSAPWVDGARTTCRWSGWRGRGRGQAPADEVAPVGDQRVGLDRRLDDDHVVHHALLAPGFGGIGGVWCPCLRAPAPRRPARRVVDGQRGA